MSSAQRQIFVIACVFDIMQFDNMLQRCFNCNYHGSESLPTRIIEPSTHWGFTCSKAAMKTIELVVKPVQNEHKIHQKEDKWCCSGVFIVTFVRCTC